MTELLTRVVARLLVEPNPTNRWLSPMPRRLSARGVIGDDPSVAARSLAQRPYRLIGGFQKFRNIKQPGASTGTSRRNVRARAVTFFAKRLDPFMSGFFGQLRDNDQAVHRLQRHIKVMGT